MQRKQCLQRFGIAAAASIGLILLFFGVWPIGNSILSYPLTVSQSPKNSDVIIVLGSGLEKNGSLGKGGMERVIESVKLFHEGFASTLLMTGGPVKSDSRRIESAKMSEYAQQLGVPENQILREEQSTSTEENAKFSKTLMQQHGFETALVVTSPYHSWRACKVFRKQHYDVVCVDADPSVVHRNIIDNLRQAKGIMREYLAVVYYQLKGYI